MLLVYGAILLLFLLQAPLQWSNKKKIVMCVAGAIVLFVISAMKEITANGDLINYASKYETLPYYGYIDLFNLWRNGEQKDFFFYVIGKLFADLGLEPRIWMGAIALIFAVAFSVFIYHHSDQLFVSVLILLVLFYGFTLSGLRQTVALAICFIAYHFAEKRKRLPFVLLILLAFVFHSSALIFLPAYWIMELKLGWKHLIAVGVAFAVAAFFPALYRALVYEYAWNETIAGYADTGVALSWAGYIIQLFIIIFCVFLRSAAGLDKEQRNRKIDRFINCMVVGLCLQSFTVVIAESFRMSYYYSIYCTVAIPNVIAGHKMPENKGWLYLAVCVCLIAYMIWSGAYSNLVFFWQV